MIYKNANKKYDKFRSFSNNYIEVSSPVYTKEDLIDIENNFNLFITGSDQVWNYKINEMDTVYFLDFVEDKSKKKSYAASFGLSEIPVKYKPIYRKLLFNYDSILVREKQASKIVKELVSEEPAVVLDPTMLLSKNEWLTIFDKILTIDDEYILVYAFGGSKKIKDLVFNIAKKTGYKILWIKNTYKYNKQVRYIKSAGPEEFLSLFYHAKYIVTNSFHGTAFSINFNKNFVTELLPESTGLNSRLENILELFGLQDRIVTSSDASIIESNIDYEKVNEKLEEERKRSTLLLKQLLEGTKNE